MALTYDIRTEKYIYHLTCHCGQKGGNVSFTEAQVIANGGFEALNKKLDSEYDHKCDNHKD